MLVPVILAAGLSTRMKAEKMLLPFGKRRVLEETIHNTCRFAGAPVVVTRRSIAEQTDLSEARAVIINEKPAQGLASSAALAAQYVAAHYPHAGILFIPGDQPVLSQAAYQQVMTAFQAQPSQIIMACYNGEKGHPTAFPARFLKEFNGITGEFGGRTVIKAHPEAVIRVSCGADCMADMDDQEQYETLCKKYGVLK